MHSINSCSNSVESGEEDLVKAIDNNVCIICLVKSNSYQHQNVSRRSTEADNKVGDAKRLRCRNAGVIRKQFASYNVPVHVSNVGGLVAAHKQRMFLEALETIIGSN